MTEQQADALMCYMDIMVEYGLTEELAAFTALCRHRDQVMYQALISKSRRLNDPTLQARINDMQTWREL